ncbi:MAG: phosphoenolpyruvate--protein phosphotransferase, partial [Ruminococcaceae bacterium]|nr:phosphoenolpyruvate--protein phosphotransferase [Oscillospiraceae bacterium]
MRVYKGKSVCGGIAFGRAKVYKKNQPTVVRKHIDDAKAECRRYEEARDKAKMELEVLYYKATKEIGEAEAQIFSIHQMMLEDADYNQSVLSIIEKQRLNAESAVLTTAESFSKMFSEMDDGYMQARAGDVRDVSDRIIRILRREKDVVEESTDGKFVIFAEDLSPSETLQMDKTRIEAFVTEKG